MSTLAPSNPKPTFVEEFFSPTNRDKTRLTFVEKCPWWVSLIIFLIFILVLVVSIVVLGVVQVPVMVVKHRDYAHDAHGFFNKSFYLLYTSEDLSPLNQELSLTIQFNKKEATNDTDPHFGFVKRDLLARVIVEGRSGNRFHQLIDVDHLTTLTCPQGGTHCFSFLLRIAPIEYPTYNIRIALENGQPLLDKGLLTSQVSFILRTTHKDYSIMSIILRCIFIVLMTLFTFVYLTVLIKKQQFLLWQSEQKFIAILLPLTILYNNPLFFLQFLAVQWVLSFINSLFIVTFFCFLMLSVLVMTHSIITTFEERSIIWFYFPKFIIVGVIWVYAVTLISLVTFMAQIGGFTIGGLGGLGPLVVIMGVLLAAYLINVGYYLVRAISKIRHLPSKKIKKLVFSWAMTGIVLLLTIVDILLFSTGVQLGAVQFNVFYIAYNIYTVSMAILYWPTLQQEFQNKEEEVEEKESMLKSDEHFESYD